MWRTDRRGSRLVAVALVCGAATTADAHSLAVERGSVEVAPDRTTVSLEVPLETLAGPRWGAQGEDRYESRYLAEAARSHEADVLDWVVIREASGERLAGLIVETELPDLTSLTSGALPTEGVTYRIDYPTAIPPSHLSFRQEPARGVSRTRPIRLVVRSSALDRTRAIQLTAGGNVETLAFDWSDDKPGSAAAVRCGADVRDDRFHTVEVRVRVEAREVVVDTIVPLPILETWLPVPRADLDFLDVGEQAAVAGAVTAFFERGDVLLADGHTVTPRVEAPRFLGPGDDVSTGDPGRLGSWTARIAVQRRYPIPTPAESLVLDWERFNAAVLTADVYVDDGDRCLESQVSTYAPRVDWSRGAALTTSRRASFVIAACDCP